MDAEDAPNELNAEVLVARRSHGRWGCVLVSECENAYMNCEFSANTEDELADRIGRAFCQGKMSKTAANERIQMMHLLRALAGTSVMRYPVRVRHTSDKVPDFQLRTGGCRVGVELTRIGFQDLEHGRALQARGLKGTLSVSELYPTGGGPRGKQAVIRNGFGSKPFVFPRSVEEEDRIWTAGARESLNAKTAVLARNDFAHGDEDWLVLVDSVGEVAEQALGRRECFSRLLAAFWKPGWFSRVFLQDNFYRWQMMFAASESSMLAVPKS